MSEPKDSDAQNLDLGALDDALGGLGDGVKQKQKRDAEADKNKDKSQGAYSIGDEQGVKGAGSDSPKTLSPSSARSASPNPAAATTTATAPPAVDAETQGKIKAIRGMFPSLDEDTVGAVLAAEGGDEESGECLVCNQPRTSPPLTHTSSSQPSMSCYPCQTHLQPRHRNQPLAVTQTQEQ